ncbi:MAG: hypothetical protein RJB38_1646 [Pseudomonadota bacterium]
MASFSFRAIGVVAMFLFSQSEGLAFGRGPSGKSSPERRLAGVAANVADAERPLTPQEAEQIVRNIETAVDAVDSQPSSPQCSPSGPIVVKPKSYEKPETTSCRQVPQAVSALFLEHYQKNGSKDSDRYAKFLAMTMKESGGKTLDITYFNSYTEVQARQDSLAAYVTMKNYLSRSAQNPKNASVGAPGGGLKKLSDGRRASFFDHQANFGLLQISADRLLGKRSAGGPKSRIGKNSKIMKEFQGATADQLVTKCGAQHFFGNDTHALQLEFQELKNCTPGNDNPSQVECFAKWMMLCPSLNLTFALNEAEACQAKKKGGCYFESWTAKPICEDIFKGAATSSAPAIANTTPPSPTATPGPAELATTPVADSGPSLAPAAQAPATYSLSKNENNLLDQVFLQDDISKNDSANQEDLERADLINNKMKELRNLVKSDLEDIVANDFDELTQASAQIERAIEGSKKELESLNQRIESETNDYRNDSYKTAYANESSKIESLERFKKNLAEKRRSAEYQGKAEDLLKSFEEHKHLEAWDIQNYRLLNAESSKNPKNDLMTMMSEMTDEKVAPAVQAQAKKKWESLLEGKQKAIDQTWVTKTTEAIVEQLDSQKATEAPENTPNRELANLLKNLFKKENPGSRYSPSAQYIENWLKKATEAVRQQKYKTVQDYFKTEIKNRTRVEDREPVDII